MPLMHILQKLSCFQLKDSSFPNEYNLECEDQESMLFFKNGPFTASFSLFSSFQHSWQYTNVW